VVGDGVIVACACPDAPLTEPAGPFAYASVHDRATGPRLVKRLVSGQLQRLW
jgi:hypothetical protein